MQNFFQKLFKVQPEGWQQTQKEAVVDLCLLGMYADNLISLAEQEFLEDESTQLHWQSGVSFSSYLQRMIPIVRTVKDDSEKMESMLKDIADRLETYEAKQKAIAELEKLASADGIVQLEEMFLENARKVMNL